MRSISLSRDTFNSLLPGRTSTCPAGSFPAFCTFELLPFLAVHAIKCVALPFQVEALIDAGVYDMETLAKEKWVTGLKYNDEVIDMLKERTRGKRDKVRSVRACILPCCPNLHL